MLLTLCIQSTYDLVEAGIYKNKKQIAFKQLHKHNASAQLIVTIDQLLRECNATLNDVSCIIANKGPGPFTTLRGVIATINGISFAKKIPLIGVNALDALAYELAQPNMINVTLLNAFGKDVYYLIDNEKTKKYGSKNIIALLSDLENNYPKQQLFFAGNGAYLHQELIRQAISQAIINQTSHCSLQSIFECGQNTYQQVYQLIPVYLKDHPSMQKPI
jgi:tRNA threonylcarbamoyladenosine biosynthesis protein TsaB